MAIAVKKFPNLRPKQYDSVRDQLKSGDLLLCSGTGIFSQMIRRWSDSVWSHVGVIMRLDDIDRVMVLESVEPIGVRAVPLSHYVRDYRDGRGYPGRLLVARYSGFPGDQPEKLKKLARSAVDRLGYSYDVDEIARIAARIGFGLFCFKRGRPRWDREYICSEYAWACYHSIGVEIDWDDRGFVAPKDFARAPAVQPVAALKVEC